MKKFVIYYRVSTKKQGDSGAGLEAQKRDCHLYLENYLGEDYEVLGEFTEIESGKKSDRPELSKATTIARKNGATVLVAKLDRLSRDVEYIAGFIKRNELKVASMPQADKFQLHIYAALAEQEREFISLRTKAALAEKKKQGIKLGVAGGQNIKAANEAKKEVADKFAGKMRTLLVALAGAGHTYKEMADALNDAGHKTPRGCEWGATGVMRVVKRLEITKVDGRSMRYAA